MKKKQSISGNYINDCIRELRLEGLTFDAIADWLNDHSIKFNGQPWKMETVQRICDCDLRIR